MRLKTKLMLYFVALMLAGIVCSGYITYKNLYQNIVNKAYEVMTITVDSVRDNKIQIIDNIETSLYIIGDIDTVKNFVDKKNISDADKKKMSEYFIDSLRNIFGVASITLMNSRGIPLASSLNLKDGINFSDRAYVAEVLKNRRAISGPFISKVSDARILSIAVLVTSKKGTHSVLAASLDMNMLARLTLGNIPIKPAEMVFIADKNGEVMYALDERIPKHISFGISELGNFGKIDIDINGVKSLAVYEYIDGDWFAFTAIPHSEIAQEVKGIRNQLITVSFTILLIVAFAMFFSMGGVINSMQKALEKESSLLKTMINSIPDFFFVKDTEGRYQACNQTFLNSLGKNSEDVIGKTDVEVFSDDPEMAKELAANCRQALETESLCVHESWIKYADHSSHLLETVLTPFGTSNGQIQGLLGISRDVTLRYNQEMVIEKTKTEALDAAKAKAEFLARMSHEIRTPLNGIIGMNSLAMSETRDPKLKNYLSKVASSADTLLSLVNDILDFSKIEAGKMSVELTPFNLFHTIGYLKDVFQPKLDEKHLEFSCNIDDDVPEMLVGDPLRVSQVLLNLLSNAVKFTEKGSVKLSVSVDAYIEDSVTLRFDIEDTGIGMSPEQLSKLFKSFSQADGSISRKYGGTGLGLSISKLLAELMGGMIEVKSEKGVGSTFSFLTKFSLTADSMPVEEERHSNADCEALLASKKVLLAEDNLINREIALTLLSQMNIYADSVNDGLQAVKAASEGQYDVILMDIQMPNMDGYEATELLREKGVDIPIIAMTANAMNEDKERAYKAGMDDHLAKPFKADEFKHILIKWLAGECRHTF